MRVTADTELIEIAPGDTGEVILDIRNTGEVIEGVSARVIGIPEQHVTARPALLPLFPDSSGRLTLAFGVPSTYPAGRHPLTVEVSTRTAGVGPTHIDVDLQVPARPALRVTARPEVVRARRRARFMLELRNDGNVALQVELSAADVERSITTEFTPSSLTIAPGELATSFIAVRGPRMLLGQELDRPLTVHAAAGDVECDVPLTLRQRPLISRGMLTALILVSIVALWAAAFLLGLGRVLGGDPLTKAAPASFFASGAAARGELGPDGQPAGLAGKGGPLAPGVGGMVTGTVDAVNTGQGIGRIVVEALRRTPDGLSLVGSAATQTDGSYTIVGLYPGNYLLRFSATGYTTVWYPQAPDEGGARPVGVTPGEATPGADVRIVGLPATIRGSIDPGDTLTPVTATVVARALDAVGATGATAPMAAGAKAPATFGAAAPATATTTTAADGTYVLSNLPSPGTYELSFTAEGYQPTTVVEKVRGGQERFEPTVRLSAGAGSIAGIVTDGRAPLGAVTVTTTVDGKEAKTATPTTGTVGRFALTGLTTPATYVLTFAHDGFATQTVVVDLGPGKQSSDLTVTLVGGTGTVTGHVVDAAGKGLGGATVTVGGTAKPATTTSLTTGDVGLFNVSGLPAPGSYTLTFTKAGYAAQTVPLVLSSDAAPPALTVTLPPSLGSITGRVTGPGGTGVVGATVTATDGKNTWDAATVGASGGTAGSFRLSNLAPGRYTVTVRAPGLSARTALVTVTAGAGASQDFALTKVS